MQTATKTPDHSASLLDLARELGAPPQRVRRMRSSLLVVLVSCCAGLGGWIVYLAITMPTGYRAKAWSAAWVGFDTLLLLSLAGTVVAAMLRRQIVVMLAVFTASLLVCDAWFDIALDWGTSGVWVSLASAAFVEVPLAGFLLYRVRTLARVALLRRWQELGLPGKPPALHRIPLFFAGGPVVPARGCEGAEASEEAAGSVGPMRPAAAASEGSAMSAIPAAVSASVASAALVPEPSPAD